MFIYWTGLCILMKLLRIQDSSAMSEESAATSDELAEQAQRLNSMVGRFQLN